MFQQWNVPWSNSVHIKMQNDNIFAELELQTNVFLQERYA